MDSLTIVRDVIAEVTGIETLPDDPHLRLSQILGDELEYRELVEECCRRKGVDPARLFASMPLAALGAGPATLSSLRNLAAFSPAALSLLRRLDVRPEDDTLHSLAASLDAGHYVSSGLHMPWAHPPRARRYVLLWTLGTLIAALGAPLAYALWSCGLGLFYCRLIYSFLYWEGARLTLPLAALVLVVAFVPGLWALWHESNRRKGRRLAPPPSPES